MSLSYLHDNPRMTIVVNFQTIIPAFFGGIKVRRARFLLLRASSKLNSFIFVRCSFSSGCNHIVCRPLRRACGHTTLFSCLIQSPFSCTVHHPSQIFPVPEYTVILLNTKTTSRQKYEQTIQNHIRFQIYTSISVPCMNACLKNSNRKFYGYETGWCLTFHL